MDPSPAVEERIRQKAEKLERFHDRIVGCTVVVEAPHRHHHKGKLYNVRVDISVPGKDVVVDRAKPIDHAHEDVYVAVRDAFDAAVRRLGGSDTEDARQRQDACGPAARRRLRRSHGLPERLGRGEPRERLLGFAQQCPLALSGAARLERAVAPSSASTARPSAISAWCVARSLRPPRASCTSLSAASDSVSAWRSPRPETCRQRTRSRSVSRLARMRNLCRCLTLRWRMSEPLRLMRLRSFDSSALACSATARALSALRCSPPAEPQSPVSTHATRSSTAVRKRVGAGRRRRRGHRLLSVSPRKSRCVRAMTGVARGARLAAVRARRRQTHRGRAPGQAPA